jgi:fatty-acyl-CoA synthase
MGNLGCLTHGACAIYPSEGFDPEAVLKAVQREKATAIYGVPTMFIAELALPNFDDYDLTSLRTGIMAGAPCPIETMKQVNELMHMTDVEIAYGMTETSPVSFQTRADSPLDKRVSTVGKVHPHVEVKIIDAESGKMCPIGKMGELCTRGYSVMLGYWENEQGTAAAIDKNGWMHTGDIAVMDEDGYVNIVGRIKDMIVRGGENDVHGRAVAKRDLPGKPQVLHQLTRRALVGGAAPEPLHRRQRDADEHGDNPDDHQQLKQRERALAKRAMPSSVGF